MAGYTGGMYIPMTGNGSMAVNSQLVNVPMLGAFFPNTAPAPYYKGSGQPPPTVPINYMSMASSGTDSSANIASANPWSFTQSPLPILIIALVGGMIWLRMVHWR